MAEITNRVQCPCCSGVGSGFALVNSPTMGGMREIECDVCHGTGKVSRELADRIKEGRRRRKDRLSRGMTLRREAERLGISPAELSNLEQGRVEDANPS